MTDPMEVGRVGPPEPAAAPCRDLPLSAGEIKRLLDAGQAGDAVRVVEYCEARLARLRPDEHLERFWLRYTEFFCSQGAGTGLDQGVVVEDLVATAERWESVPARATALACRAMLAATRGRYAEANPDLGRAVVLLSDVDGPSADEWPGRHLWRMGCNTLAIALNRQGFYDQAAHWLHVTRTFIHDHGVSAEFGMSVITFNEAWIHLAAAIERDLGELGAPEGARASYLEAAQLFRQSEVEATHEPGRSPVIGPGRTLAAVAATLADDATTVGDLVELTDEPLRPDHRALKALALAHRHAALGEVGRATELLDGALASLPADHSYRSIAARIQWEKIRIAGATSTDAQASALHGMVDILLGERRAEYRTRRAAFEERLQQELDRAALIAERAAAELDPLTGLLSRRTLEARLSSALSCLGEGHSAFLVFIDLDEFKLVNDRRSHLAGDLTLRHLGETLRSRLRGADFAARYGGDEFILVLFDRLLVDIRAELTLLQQEFVEITATHPDIGTPVTFTAGALPLDPTATPHELLHRADLAMIAGKRAGRGHITTFLEGG